MPFNLGDDTARLFPGSRFVTKTVIENLRLLRRPTNRTRQEVFYLFIEHRVGLQTYSVEGLV